MNLVDSSGWLEYFAEAPNALFFAPPIQNLEILLVPAITIFEVFKRVLLQKSEQEALEAVAIMMQGKVIELDATTAISAAKLSGDLRLPMADSIILATARMTGATLWTQDVDFAAMEGVKYVAKQ
jgi:predicted nucleic acid-binding protein